MEITLIILSGLCLLLFISNLIFIRKCNILTMEKLSAISEKDKMKEKVTEIIPGDRVTFRANLVSGRSNTSNGESFEVQYEANVMEVSSSQLKVDPYDVIGITKIPIGQSSKPNCKQLMIDLFKGSWVDRDRISLMLDKEDIRQSKIDKILQ